MNWVDLVIVAVLLLFTLEGLGKPLIAEVFSLFSFILSFLLSLKFYNLAAKQLAGVVSLPHSLANVLGFMIIWYLVEIILFALSRLLFLKVLKFKLPGSEILSVIPAFLRGVIFIALILVLVGTFPIQPKIKKDVNESILGSWILDRTYKLEAPIKSVFGELANDTLTFLTVKPKTDESVNLGFTNNSFSYDEDLEKRMVDLVNKERVSRGLNALVYDPRLTQVARLHSADMFKRGFFAHYSPEGEDVADRASKFNVRFLVIGENLAYAPSLEIAHNGLMNSPGHKANILSLDFNKVGIGVANGGEYGIMFTQVFTN